MAKQKQNNAIDTRRHSYAHLMAAAIQKLYPEAKFGVGPVIENGFYYDILTKKPIAQEDLVKIEKEMREILKHPFTISKKILSLNEAKKLFKKLNQNFKLDLLNDIEKHGTTEYNKIDEARSKNKEARSKKIKEVSIYQLDDFIDLCRGPHVKNISELNSEAFKLEKIAGAYWRGQSKNAMLSRIYGLAFNTKKELDDFIKLQEEIAKRDHRKIGANLKLFAFEDIAPGAPFYLPKGMIIFKELEKILRKVQEESGYQEISTPILVKKELWEKSGHWQNYKENMFILESDKEIFGLKPMNCPESAFVYKNLVKSWRDLPIRLSEIGRLHRNELTGTLGGMFRVRQLTMDDAHIYSREDQLADEIEGVMNLIRKFYNLFEFTPEYSLSTKPNKAIGNPKLWKKAEDFLKQALEKNNLQYKLKSKEGAFYGPKIDVEIKDSLGRKWQLATIQIDFNLSERFNLTYVDEKNKEQRPVVIHRAIFGSFERFIGILIEHFAGDFPFWLNPVQIAIIPISEKYRGYSNKISDLIKKEKFRIKMFQGDETLGKRIREAELEKIPYILVMGEKEESAQTVSVRTRKSGNLKQITINDFLNQIKDEARIKI